MTDRFEDEEGVVLLDVRRQSVDGSREVRRGVAEVGHRDDEGSSCLTAAQVVGAADGTPLAPPLAAVDAEALVLRILFRSREGRLGETELESRDPQVLPRSLVPEVQGATEVRGDCDRARERE